MEYYIGAMIIICCLIGFSAGWLCGALILILKRKINND